MHVYFYDDLEYSSKEVILAVIHRKRKGQKLIFLSLSRAFRLTSSSTILIL